MKHNIYKISFELQKVSTEISTYLSGWRKKKQPLTQFMIFYQPRTGSNLLCDLLHSHPQIYCDGEIFSARQVRRLLFPAFYLRCRRVKYENQVYGFKASLYQINNRQKLAPQRFILNLYKEKWKIIHIYRDNILRQAVSYLIAQQRKKWKNRAIKPLKGQQFHIDTNELIKRMEKQENDLMKEKKIIEALPHITIAYERDLLSAEQHQATADKIFDYLGLASVAVKTKFVRTSSDNLADFIENYEEVVNVISQTKYAKFLHDL